MSNTRSDVLEINNGIIGAASGHPLLANIVNKISKLNGTTLPYINKNKTSVNGNVAPGLESIMSFLEPKDTAASALLQIQNERAAMDIIAMTGPGLLTREVFEYLKDKNDKNDTTGDIHILPVHVFHAVPNSTKVNMANQEELTEVRDKYTTDRSLAVHWWQQSWKE